jgi:hypothetical protein
MSWGVAHSERSVARTNSLLLDNRSQVRDNGIKHEHIDILHSKLHLSTGAPGGWYQLVRQQSTIGWVSRNYYCHQGVL